MYPLGCEGHAYLGSNSPMVLPLCNLQSNLAYGSERQDRQELIGAVVLRGVQTSNQKRQQDVCWRKL